MFEVVFGIDEATTDKQLLAGLRDAAVNYDDALADLRCLVGSVVDGVRWLTFLGSARMDAGFFEESLQPHVTSLVRFDRSPDLNGVGHFRFWRGDELVLEIVSDGKQLGIERGTLRAKGSRTAIDQVGLEAIGWSTKPTYDDLDKAPQQVVMHAAKKRIANPKLEPRKAKRGQALPYIEDEFVWRRVKRYVELKPASTRTPVLVPLLKQSGIVNLAQKDLGKIQNVHTLQVSELRISANYEPVDLGQVRVAKYPCTIWISGYPPRVTAAYLESAHSIHIQGGPTQLELPVLRTIKTAEVTVQDSLSLPALTTLDTLTIRLLGTKAKIDVPALTTGTIHIVAENSYSSTGDLGSLNVPAKHVTFSGFSATTVKRLQKKLR